MADPFVAEIRMFAGNFAPKGWATCDGQLLPISQNTALFSLVGTYYGGDGKSTFALPNMAGNVPMAQGQGPGLSERFLGEIGGAASITLLSSEMPLHPHSLQADSFDTGDNRTPGPGFSMAKTSPGNAYQSATTPLVQMNLQALSIAGQSLPHNNMMPFLTLYFIIALQGVFPPRS